LVSATYDLITVGGGLGGAALAKVMAERGARVLVVERERRFGDRVRGEALAPWGVGEARTLGLEPLLRATCGHELRWIDLAFAGAQVVHRDLSATTPQATGWMSFFHPDMQEAVLEAAARAGAEVRRGARVRDVEPGAMPEAIVEHDGRTATERARLVVGADGRASAVRKWGGFTVCRDPQRLLFSGVLFDGHGAPDATSSIFFHPSIGRISLFFPQGGGRVRAYVGYHKDAAPPPEAGRDVRCFIAESVRAGVDPSWYVDASAAGPLALFEGADAWVEHPYRDGVVLIGDAAATSDPTWGQGMSLTLRDVRVLRDALCSDEDWTRAADAYADTHHRHYDVVHRVDGWSAEFFMQIGNEADAVRARALPLIAADPTRIPDIPFSGPDLPAGDDVRARFFGE
jgi:2-polyprenyl-6-methoxyphenol hydroxylase-like FAD-dependent oxidoreductase